MYIQASAVVQDPVAPAARRNLGGVDRVVDLEDTQPAEVHAGAESPATAAESSARLLQTRRPSNNQRTKPMGEIRANVILENTGDRTLFDRGHGQETDVRRSTVDGIVDTGAVTLVLPQNVVERLGLEQQGTAFVTYADERREERPLAGPVSLRFGNRTMVTNCVVGPPLSEILIGQVVLETLDLIADCTNRTLTPRYPDYPLLKLKAISARTSRRATLR